MIKTWEERLNDMAHFDQRGYEEDKDACKLAEIADLRTELERLNNELTAATIRIDNDAATIESFIVVLEVIAERVQP